MHRGSDSSEESRPQRPSFFLTCHRQRAPPKNAVNRYLPHQLLLLRGRHAAGTQSVPPSDDLTKAKAEDTIITRKREHSSPPSSTSSASSTAARRIPKLCTSPPEPKKPRTTDGNNNIICTSRPPCVFRLGTLTEVDEDKDGVTEKGPYNTQTPPIVLVGERRKVGATKFCA